MKLAIIGSRSFDNYDFLKTRFKDIGEIEVVISGGAKGADALAEKWALENNIPTKIFLPDFKKFGRGAYRMRNEEIVNLSDEIIAFWDGKSKGTKNSITYARKKNKLVTIISF